MLKPIMASKNSSQKGFTTKIEIEIETQINPIAVILARNGMPCPLR